jgi:histidinol-phosphate aminotransferase
MTGEYQRPFAAPGGLRLHLNENTAGCSPRVLAALEALTGEDIAFYPDYGDVERETAAFLGVPRSQLVLTNGLDEGIFVTIVAAARETVAGESAIRPEVIVPLPAFDMYGVTARAVGAQVVEVPPQQGFRLPVASLLAAVTPRTRIVFITSPNNPTGVRVSLDEIDEVSAALPPGAIVFVDEAYHDFCGDTALPLLATRSSVIVGRTFAKGHGLAALRAGCLIGQAEVLARIRTIVPPYSLNVCAAAGLRAALADRERLAWYVAQVDRSRRLVYALCDRLGLTYWESGANFVLVRVGTRADEVVSKLAARGIFVRDRSGEPGCEGCVRITAGVVDHTQQCLLALEEILCGVR